MKIQVFNDYRETPPGPFDLAIYDPPFDIWAGVSPRVEAKNIICFTNFQRRPAVEKLFGPPKFELVWHFKDARWVSHNMPRLSHESVLIYGPLKRSAYVGERIADRTPKKKGRGSVGRDRLAERTYTPRERKLLDSVFICPRNVRSGVWTKPEPLCDALVEWLLPPGGSVWDGFAGSGIFGQSAAKFGAALYVGAEIDTSKRKNLQRKIAAGA